MTPFLAVLLAQIISGSVRMDDISISPLYVPPPSPFSVAPSPVPPYQIDTTSATQAFLALFAGCQGNDSGYSLAGNVASYPLYVAQVTLNGTATYVWADPTTDARALVKPDGSGERVAACWYADTAFTVTITFNDVLTHAVRLYFLDWDGYGGGRTETLDVLDSGGTVLSTQTISGFQNGQYIVLSLSGQPTLRITSTNPAGNAVLSAIYFDASPAALTCEQGFVQACALPPDQIPSNCQLTCTDTGSASCNAPIIQDANGVWWSIPQTP